MPGYQGREPLCAGRLGQGVAKKLLAVAGAGRRLQQGFAVPQARRNMTNTVDALEAIYHVMLSCTV